MKSLIAVLLNDAKLLIKIYSAEYIDILLCSDMMDNVH